jgi:hypothetical protein
MISRLLSTTSRTAFFAMGLALMAPVAVMAQDAPAFAPSTLTLTAADGTATEYKVNDVSVYVSTNAAYDDVPASTSLSLSVTTITPVDAELLKWAAQTTEETKDVRAVKITSSLTTPDGKPSDLVYEVTDGHVSSFSATNSTTAEPSLSLTIDATKVLINGVQMN